MIFLLVILILEKGYLKLLFGISSDDEYLFIYEMNIWCNRSKYLYAHDLKLTIFTTILSLPQNHLTLPQNHVTPKSNNQVKNWAFIEEINNHVKKIRIYMFLVLRLLFQSSFPWKPSDSRIEQWKKDYAVVEEINNRV